MWDLWSSIIPPKFDGFSDKSAETFRKAQRKGTYMPKYKVCVYGTMDGLVFDDLLVKYTTGYQYPLKIKRNHYVPTEIFNPLDIQRSLTVGSLRNYIDSGSVLVEYSDLETNKRKKKSRKKKVEDVTPEIKPSVEVVPEVPKEEPQQKPEETKEFKPIDLKDVKASDDFFKLSFYNKLQYITHCKDKGLLTELLEKLKDQPTSQLHVKISYILQHL